MGGASVTVERLPDGQSAVVRVTRGQCPTGGYGIAITGVRRAGAVLTVVCALTDPAPGAMVTMALTFPAAAVTLPAGQLPPSGGRVVAVDAAGQVLAACVVP